MKQINADATPRPRGRPRKSEAERKQSSVRIRPGLHEQLTAAASESGQSVARELESRLERTFTDAPMREPTSTLVQKIAAAVQELEAGTGKSWDRSLPTWAMLREVLANGPILEMMPQPDPAAAKELTAFNEKLVKLTIERDTIVRSLILAGVPATGEPTSVNLGAAFLGYSSAPDRQAAKAAIEEREDLPADIRSALLEQVDRLEELDSEIDKLRDKVTRAMLPYIEARKAARQFLYDTNGAPDLPAWLTAPVGMDQPPQRKPRGMFAGR